MPPVPAVESEESAALSTEMLEAGVIAAAKKKKTSKQRREYKAQRQVRLERMSRPLQKNVDASNSFRKKLERQQNWTPKKMEEKREAPMSEETLQWIERAARAKANKLQALAEFQHRLQESKMSPAEKHHRNQRPNTTLSPTRQAWCRSASTPKRVATPYVSGDARVSNGAFGCTGSRFTKDSEFASKIGPGEYGIVNDPRAVSNTGACKFNLSETPDFITMAINNSKSVPGIKYDPTASREYLESRGGGKFNLSQTMDTIDQAVYLRKDVPGPGKYKSSFEGIEARIQGVIKFSDEKYISDLDRIITESSQSPGPSEYMLPSPMLGAGGGRFSDADTPDFITMAVNRAKLIPGMKYDPSASLSYLESNNVSCSFFFFFFFSVLSLPTLLVGMQTNSVYSQQFFLLFFFLSISLHSLLYTLSCPYT